MVRIHRRFHFSAGLCHGRVDQTPKWEATSSKMGFLSELPGHPLLCRLWPLAGKFDSPAPFVSGRALFVFTVRFSHRLGSW